MKTNQNDKEVDSEGKKKNKNRNPKEQTTKQKQSKTKQSADSKKIPKENQNEQPENNEDEQGITLLQGIIQSIDRLRNSQNRRARDERKDKKEFAEANLMEYRKDRLAKKMRLAGDALEALGKSVSRGYSEGQSLRSSRYNYFKQ